MFLMYLCTYVVKESWCDVISVALAVKLNLHVYVVDIGDHACIHLMQD